MFQSHSHHISFDEWIEIVDVPILRNMDKHEFGFWGDLKIWGLLKMMDPQVTMGVNTKAWSNMSNDWDDLGVPPFGSLYTTGGYNIYYGTMVH